MSVPSRICRGFLLVQAKWTARWRAGEVKASNQIAPGGLLDYDDLTGLDRLQTINGLRRQ